MFGLEIIAHAGGIYSTCTSAKRSERGFFFLCQRLGSDAVCHIVFVSFPLKEHTLPWNKWAVIQCHCVSQHEITEECNYHFAQQTFH